MPKRELNILFTCAGRRVELMQRFREAMAQLGLTGRVLATDITMSSPAMRKADQALLVSRVGQIDYIPALREYARKHRVGLLIPVTDVDLRSLARHREEFAKDGCTVMIGDENIINICRDKSKTNQLFAKAGLGAIDTRTLAEFRLNPYYPCFVKPVRGSAGIGTGAILTPKDMDIHVATFGDQLLVQEYVPGQEYTIDIFRTRQGQIKCVVPRQRLVVRSGEVEKAITAKDAELIDAATKIGQQLDTLWGVACLQCRREKGKSPRFFEINPRFGGGATLSISAGANLPLYVLQEILGLPVTAKMGEFTDRLLMMRYDEGVYAQVDDPSALPGFDSPMFR